MPPASARATAGMDRLANSPETSSVSQAPRVTGGGAGTSVAATTASAGTMLAAPSPSAAQATAVATIATRIVTGGSCAAAAASLRGSALDVIPNALTKPAAAMPAAGAP